MASKGSAVFDRQEQFRQRIEALLREAAQHFNTRGFHGTSLDRIAERLNITKAALYHYVKNKQELLFQTYMRAAELALQSTERAQRDGNTGLEKVKLFIRYQLEVFGSVTGPAAVVSDFGELDEKQRAQLLRRTDVVDDRIRGFIRRGITDKSIAPCEPKIAEFAIIGALNWVPKWYSPEGDKSAAQIAETFVQLFEHGLSR